MNITITLTDGRSTREALAGLVEHCRAERDYCDANGRSTRAEAHERIAVAIEELPAPREAAHYPNGMGRTKLPAALIEKTLKTAGTGRNWNTVTKLLEMAEKLEGSR